MARELGEQLPVEALEALPGGGVLVVKAASSGLRRLRTAVRSSGSLR